MSEALDAANRIIKLAERPFKERPTIEELERILQQPDGPPVTINPDGSIGAGTNNALTVARAYLAAYEALVRITNTPSRPFPDPGAHSVHVYASAVRVAWSDIQRIARAALADDGATSDSAKVRE